MELKLPLWKDCAGHVDVGTACALELFIYHNEPADVGPEFQSEADFREGLLAALKEVRAAFETETCACWRCVDARRADSADASP